MTNITEEKKDNTLLITINRPKVYNALDAATKLELAKAFEKASTRDDIRCVVLTGEGKAFCTGQDLNDRKASGAGEQKNDLGHTLKTEWNPLVKSIRDCKHPVIAAINGVTAGAGVSVALSCDLLVASPQVKFVSGFSKIGLCPDAGSNYSLVRSLGYQKAFEFFVLSEPLSAQTLQQHGVVNCIDELPLRAAMEYAIKLNRIAPLSVTKIKKTLQSAQESDFETNLSNEIKAQRELGWSEDFQEGVQAFLDKRDPKFKGQ